MQENKDIYLPFSKTIQMKLIDKIIIRLSLLTHAIINSNKVGNISYSTCILLEHIIIAFCLLTASDISNISNELINTGFSPS